MNFIRAVASSLRVSSWGTMILKNFTHHKQVMGEGVCVTARHAKTVGSNVACCLSGLGTRRVEEKPGTVVLEIVAPKWKTIAVCPVDDTCISHHAVALLQYHGGWLRVGGTDHGGVSGGQSGHLAIGWLTDEQVHCAILQDLSLSADRIAFVTRRRLLGVPLECFRQCCARKPVARCPVYGMLNRRQRR